MLTSSYLNKLERDGKIRNSKPDENLSNQSLALLSLSNQRFKRKHLHLTAIQVQHPAFNSARAEPPTVKNSGLDTSWPRREIKIILNKSERNTYGGFFGEVLSFFSVELVVAENNKQL